MDQEQYKSSCNIYIYCLFCPRIL